MKAKWLIGACMAAVLASCASDKVDREIALIPQAKTIQTQNGAYVIGAGTEIGFQEEELAPAADYLAAMLGKASGKNLKTVQGKAKGINLSIDPSLQHTDEYVLDATSDGVAIKGQSYRGVMLGIQSLRQLLPAQIEQSADKNANVVWNVPAVTIQDFPTTEWRGMMLDVSRHFYTKDEVKNFLNQMALYKMNKFHWHLTDDQGWRIEIKKYPLLTEKGAFRKLNSHDRECLRLVEAENNTDFNLPADRIQVVEGDTIYGGYYTQEDIKEIVSYATQLGIDVIPEIDMPGHFSAAIANYPFIACFNEAGWGHTFSAPMCPGKDSVLEFAQDVYDEVFALFPYEYVHLGADEVEKDNWKKCPNCQKRIKAEKLKDEYELQSWFVKQMEKHFNENGKKLIGWDEILEGGLSETATIMWWRGWEKDAVHRATAQGNPAILTPTSHFYFDYRPDAKTLPSVYSFNPALEGLSPEQVALVKGIQANVWCEWIPSKERFEFMIYPRMTAVAEVAWGSQGEYADYVKRLIPHYNRWDVMGINYRIPDLEGFATTNVFLDTDTIDIACILPSAEIRYTTDGSVPTKESTLYTEPIVINESADFTFRTFRPDGSADEVVKTSFVKQALAEPAAVDAASLKNGLSCKSYEKKYKNCENFADGAKLLNTQQVDKVAIPAGAKGFLGLEFNGYIEVPEDGIYSFALLSDDGSRLYVNDCLVVDNDGPHGPKEVIGQYAMKKGLHPIKIYYFDGNNGGQLALEVTNSKGEVLPLQFLN